MIERDRIAPLLHYDSIMTPLKASIKSVCNGDSPMNSVPQIPIRIESDQLIEASELGLVFE